MKVSPEAASRQDPAKHTNAGGNSGAQDCWGGQLWAPGHSQGRTAYLNLVKAGQCSSALPPKTSPVTAWSRGGSRVCHLTQPLSGPMIPGRAFKLAAASVSLMVKWGCTAYPPGHHEDTMRYHTAWETAPPAEARGEYE